MQTAEETVSWLIFPQRENLKGTTVTDNSSCSILSKASLLSSRRVPVKIQLLKKNHAPGSDSTDFSMQIHISR